jgi:hypothetical protein
MRRSDLSTSCPAQSIFFGATELPLMADDGRWHILSVLRAVSIWVFGSLVSESFFGCHRRQAKRAQAFIINFIGPVQILPEVLAENFAQSRIVFERPRERNGNRNTFFELGTICLTVSSRRQLAQDFPRPNFVRLPTHE